MNADTELRPGEYARIARQTDVAMRLLDRSCTRQECDLGAPCPRHARIPAVVARYERLAARPTYGIVACKTGYVVRLERRSVRGAAKTCRLMRALGWAVFVLPTSPLYTRKNHRP